MRPAYSLRQWMGLVIQLGLGGLFVYAGVAKWLDPLRFASSLLGYQLFPMGLIDWLVPLFPWVEIMLGMAMMLGVMPRFTGAMVGGLLVVFTALVSHAYANQLVIDCGCFGAPRPVDAQKIIENVAMIGAAWAWWREWVTPVSVWSWARGLRRQG